MSLNVADDCAGAEPLVDKNCEEHRKLVNLSKLLAEGEADISAGRVRSARAFLSEFMHAHHIARIPGSRNKSGKKDLGS